MTTSISHETVREYFRACVSRDPVRIGHFLDENVEWSLSGPVDLLPFCGQRSGRAAVVETLVRHVPSVIRLTDMRLEQVLVDGDRAASYMHLIAVHASSGRTVSYRSAQFLRFHNGKIVEFRGVIDSFDAAEQVLGHAINTSVDVPMDFTTGGNRVAL